MKRLWAPWRIEYIQSEKEAGCLFCRCWESDEDRENLVLVRSDKCFCMLNRYPYNSGHLMISPVTHCSRLSELSVEELSSMMQMAQELEQLLDASMNPEGFNFGFNVGTAAGAGIDDHLHLHIVPRWNGDTNFMPVLDDTRVVPQSLDDLYDYLSKAIKKSHGE